MKQKKYISIFIVSVISFLLMSFSILIMPFGEITEDSVDLMGILPGVFFWLGLIIGVVTQIILGALRRKDLRNMKKENEKLVKKRIGLISLFSNKISIIVDVLFFISVIWFVVMLIFTEMSNYISFISLSLLVLSFIMHCVFNGKVFYYITNRNK